VNDAFGTPQSVAVFGGTSEIGLAVLRELGRTGRTTRVVLAGRDADALATAAADVSAWTGAAVTSTAFDAADATGHDAAVAAAFAGGDLDVAVLAFGVLGDQDALMTDPDGAVDLVTVNYVAGVSVGLRVAERMRAQGHGTLVVLSSVAGERGRASNFVYGSSKAGLDTFAQGLGDRLAGTGVRVLVVRPGFVRTRMTEGLAEAPLACDADDVARAVVRALASGRQTVWVPAALRPVMSGLRHLPRPVFRRLDL
jgi:decaprenylphospho-beta-D-erythro-pentofuranosid-2-ulose 2-reductase